jgi:uncharacterized protein (TIGR03382 family)
MTRRPSDVVGGRWFVVFYGASPNKRFPIDDQERVICEDADGDFPVALEAVPSVIGGSGCRGQLWSRGFSEPPCNDTGDGGSVAHGEPRPGEVPPAPKESAGGCSATGEGPVTTGMLALLAMLAMGLRRMGGEVTPWSRRPRTTRPRGALSASQEE